MNTGDKPQLDVIWAHRHFSAQCFNATWTLIEKQDRTTEDNEAMLLTALASLWHWTQRPDCTPQNLSIGHWQVSRVYALLGQGANALHHGQRCLHFSHDLPPFYLGYAHEALARAAAVMGDSTTLRAHLEQARACARAVEENEDRQQLEQDLQTISSVSPA